MLRNILSDVIVYYDFESLPAGSTAIGAPQFVAAKKNKGIHFPNLDYETGIGLTLRGPETTCMEDLSQCESGLSLAYWIKMESLPAGFPSTFRSTSISIQCKSAAFNAPRSSCWFR